jgi:hypothetical protein
LIDFVGKLRLCSAAQSTNISSLRYNDKIFWGNTVIGVSSTEDKNNLYVTYEPGVHYNGFLESIHNLRHNLYGKNNVSETETASIFKQK